MEAAVPLSRRGGTPSNTMWPRPRSISAPSVVFIHPVVWPQRTLDKNWGLCPLEEGKLGPHLTQSHLGFWIVNEIKYLLLAPLAQDLLSAPASEAYVEFVFSVCGKLTAGKRNRLMKGLEKRIFLKMNKKYYELERWANAQRDGRPAEHRWRPLFNAAKFGWRSLLYCCAVTLPRRESRSNLEGWPKLVNRSQFFC